MGDAVDNHHDTSIQLETISNCCSKKQVSPCLLAKAFTLLGPRGNFFWDDLINLPKGQFWLTNLPQPGLGNREIGKRNWTKFNCLEEKWKHSRPRTIGSYQKKINVAAPLENKRQSQLQFFFLCYLPQQQKDKSMHFLYKQKLTAIAAYFSEFSIF